jgi:hypothetical protein
MIKFSLGCNNHHSFEAWFRSGDAFDRQAGRQLVVCPECGSTTVEKAPMAPALLKAGRAKSETTPSQTMQKPSGADLRRLRGEMLAKSEHVGKGFAEEARRIHFGEADERSIHGEASIEDARGLIDDGVPFGLVPPLPEDQN